MPLPPSRPPPRVEQGWQVARWGRGGGGTPPSAKELWGWGAGLSLTQKKKVRAERGNFKRARGQYMSSPRCSQLFNHESLAPNWSQHTTI